MTEKGKHQIFEKIYEKSGAVWTYDEPSKIVLEFLKSKIKPCKVLDVVVAKENTLHTLQRKVLMLLLLISLKEP